MRAPVSISKIVNFFSIEYACLKNKKTSFSPDLSGCVFKTILYACFNSSSSK